MHRHTCHPDSHRANLLRELQEFEDSLQTDVSDQEDGTWWYETDSSSSSEEEAVGAGRYYDPLFQGYGIVHKPRSVSTQLVEYLYGMLNSCIQTFKCMT